MNSTFLATGDSPLLGFSVLTSDISFINIVALNSIRKYLYRSKRREIQAYVSLSEAGWNYKWAHKENSFESEEFQVLGNCNDRYVLRS